MPSKTTRRSSSRGRSKSPARTKSSSRSSRSKSPARTKSRGRSKSPARTKRPSRSKSPARTKASTSKPTRSSSRGRSPARKPPSPKPAPKQTKTKEPKKEVVKETKREVKKEEVKVVQSSSSSNAGSSGLPRERPTRVSARLAEKRDTDSESSSSSSTSSRHQMTSTVMSGKAKRSYEFGGPAGTCFLSLLMFATVFVVNYGCTSSACNLQSFTKLSVPKKLSAFFNAESAVVYLGWFLFQAFLAVLPFGGKSVKGVTTPTGKLTYRCNGFFALLVSLAGFALAAYLKYPVTFLYRNMLQLACTSMVFSFMLSIMLYVKSSWAKTKQLVPENNTGCTMYDFFMGRELNPRIGPLDLKFFCELRPGLIGWLMLNLSICAQACQVTGGAPPPALIAVTIAQGLYVADSLFFEEAILTTMDIVHDGFGFMLVFGDLAWVPFLYGLQARYILEHGTNVSIYGLSAIAAFNFLGYVIFRMSNSQKNAFRKNPRDPALAHLKSIATPSGKRLLVSGWWGLVRKPNYLGDLIMAISWSLYCGCNSCVPYFYPASMLLLLLHRSYRDDQHCQQKHGSAWQRYCGMVKYRIFPYVY